MFFKQTPKFWQTRNWLSWLMWPISLLYLLLLTCHKLLYQLHLKKITIFSVPVIVVGNITVGGTGKTPLVIKLAKLLTEQGFTPGIISRGYGGSNRKPLVVTSHSNCDLVGDEALVIARNVNCPLVITPQRVTAAQKLINEFKCDVILSDDGLQHYALGRTVEIAVIDGENRYGNGFCLPAGPLREPLSRLKKVNFIVVNSGKANSGEYEMQIVPDKFYQIDHDVAKYITEFVGQKIHAVAALGNPQRFFNFLRSLNLDIIEHPFPDHYRFNAQDFSFADNSPVVMTEKDAVKCEGFAKQNFWYLKIDLNLSDRFSSSFLQNFSLGT